MSGLELRRVVDDDLAHAVPELRPYLGQEVVLTIAAPAPERAGGPPIAAPKARVSVSEFIAMRRSRGSST